MDTHTFEVKQVKVLQQLTRELPLNDYGLPIGIYRTDILPWHAHIDYGNGSCNTGNTNRVKLLDEPPKTAHTSSTPTPPIGSEELQLANDLLSGNDDNEPNNPNDTNEAAHLPTVTQDEHRIAGFITNELESAFVWMNYDEGFPALPNGSPFWENLGFEPNEAYSVFTRYLQMHQGRVGDADDEEDYGVAATGIRSITILVTELHRDDELLLKTQQYQMYYHLYYWGLRAKAYDIFKIAQHRKQQELRAIEVEDSHFITAQRLMNKLSAYMDDEEGFWDMMTPKTAIDLFKTLTQLQRVSAGLPGAAPASNEVGKRPTAAGLGHILKQVAQETVVEIEDNKSATKLIEEALKDPMAVAQLQKLVIGLTQQGDT